MSSGSKSYLWASLAWQAIVAEHGAIRPWRTDVSDVVATGLARDPGRARVALNRLDGRSVRSRWAARWPGGTVEGGERAFRGRDRHGGALRTVEPRRAEPVPAWGGASELAEEAVLARLRKEVVPFHHVARPDAAEAVRPRVTWVRPEGGVVAEWVARDGAVRAIVTRRAAKVGRGQLGAGTRKARGADGGFKSAVPRAEESPRTGCALRHAHLRGEATVTKKWDQLPYFESFVRI
jgi:hypothetical protein